MDTLSKTEFEDLSLQTSLEHLVDSQGKNIIELALVLTKKTQTNQTTKQSLTLEDAGLIVLVEGQQMPNTKEDIR